MMRFDTFNTLAALNAVAVSAAGVDKIEVTGNKRVYYCQRCLNHNRLEPRKNHKCECLYATCTCNKCILVEKRRVLNTQLHELEEVVDSEMQAEIEEQLNPSGSRVKGERVPNCQKCGQHGRKSRLKGHKRICPYRDCNCAKCQVVSERQKLMADQIKIRRRQRKDTLMNITRENITATLNAAAVVAAAGPLPYLNNFNALLYKQLQQTMHQPPSSFVSSSSPTGSVTESNSYSPTSSINNTFTPSPPDVLKAAVSAQTAASSAIPTSLAQLPSLLFHATPAVSAASLGASTAGRALPGAVATATATNGAAASCFSSLIDSLNNATAPIAMPVAINPSLLSAAAACSSSSSTSAAAVHAVQQAAAHSNHPLMNLSSMIDNEQLLQSLLNNVRLLEQKMCSIEKQSHDETNTASSAFVDVCSV